MTDLIATLDLRDVFYSAIGLALLGLTFEPALARHRLVNMPLFFIIAGVILAVLGLPTIDPRRAEIESRVIEHISELIVIISLAGAGLAIDTRMTWKNWEAAFRLLAIAMPLTIAAVALAGVLWLGMSLAAAMLLAAALAPTDPVLARSVQVGPPGADETPMSLALTAEAGLNDGLAFPFVYLAISIATYGMAADGGIPDWFWGWLGFDLAYRVTVGWFGGLAVGWAINWVLQSRLADPKQGGRNAVVVVLAGTLLSYGLVEAIDGYGFLAVFASARAFRAMRRGAEDAFYERLVHHGADQLESILLALLLLWLGLFFGSGGLSGLDWDEYFFAIALVFVVRPAVGLISLIGLDSARIDTAKVSFFGVRGMGSVFYIAYAQNSAEFPGIDGVWRVAGIVILISIIAHGFTAKVAVDPGEGTEDDKPEMHPMAERKDRRAAE